MTTANDIAWISFKNAGYLLVLFIGLSHQSYTILAAFMVLDTILGIVRVGIVHGGQAIRSYRLISGLTAKLSVILVPLVIAYTGQGIGLDLHLLATWSLNVLILAHAYSIFGNIRSIHTRTDVYEFDAVSWLLTKIQTAIEYQIKRGAADKNPEIPTNRDITTQPVEDETFNTE